MFNCPKQAQTPEQRRRNAKFAKENEMRMGKSEEQIKKRVKEAQKSPISTFWLGTAILATFYQSHDVTNSSASVL